jgi:hypothetical protein
MSGERPIIRRHRARLSSSWITDDISETARNASLPEMVGDVEKDSEMLAANSPILNASKLKAPLRMAKECVMLLLRLAIQNGWFIMEKAMAGLY